MIKAVFYHSDKTNAYTAFIISGHAGEGAYGQDILCAAVSSAVMLVTNSITDFIKAKAVVKTEENKVGVKLISENAAASSLIESLENHLRLIDENGKIRILHK